MFVELHIIQNFPPSNLNRDDLGQPKDTLFGGFRRARVSSQCLKRSIRYAGQHVPTNTPPLLVRQTGVPLSMRTHLLVEKQLVPRLLAAGKLENEARQVATELARAYSGKMHDRKRQETAALLFLTVSEVEEITGQLLAQDWPALLAQLAEAEAKNRRGKKAESEDEKKEEKEEKGKVASVLKPIVDALIKTTERRTSAPDMALFGRMLADKPETNVDAACQVAHAISTHNIAGRTPIDYFTAVDDLRDDPGAGYLDVAYFASACFYRYARLDFEQLKVNLMADDDESLHDLACRSVEAFLRASERAIPSGKKNAYAQECRPSFMLAVVRAPDSEGWSLVNAFQKPVNPESEGDLVVASVRRLENLFEHLADFYGDDSVLKTAVALPDGLVSPKNLGRRFESSVMKMNDWVEAVVDLYRREGHKQ